MSIKRNGTGGRLIEMLDAGNTNDNVIQLGHEAYRDGMVSNNQYKETVNAVIGHTALAARMKDAGLDFDTSGLLGAEIDAYNRGDMNALVANALTNYDSTGDYWKVLNNGNIVFDGQKNLVDENGEILYIAKNQNSFTGSLSEILNTQGMKMSPGEINQKLINIGLSIVGDRIFRGNTDVTEDAAYQIETTGEFKARYEFQTKYAGQVMEKFGGSMKNAVSTYVADMIKAGYNEFMTGQYTEKTDAAIQMRGNFMDYANEYDATMAVLYSSKLNAQYESTEGKAAMGKIFDSIRNSYYSDTNPAYDAFRPNGILNPVQGGDTRVSTYAFYDDGTNHGWGNPRGFATDISTKRVQGYAVYTNLAGRMLTSGSINTNNPLNLGTGNEVRLFGNNNTSIYGHMQSNNNATELLKKLIQTTQSANLWYVPLSAGTQIGTVGNTGNVYPKPTKEEPNAGSHLHWEIREKTVPWMNRTK